MVLSLLLPWFPIILAVGVGGRLLGRTRGLGMGVLCALFWVVLVQASAGLAVWRDPWVVLTLVTGAVAIAAMGCWAGENPTTAFAADSGNPSAQPADTNELAASLTQLSIALDQFGDWLEQNRLRSDPWPAFDEFLRATLYQCCRATHIKIYRLLTDGEHLSPLHHPDPLGDEERLPTNAGVIGHVLATGRSSFAYDSLQDTVERKAADRAALSIAWCFPIRSGTRRLGVVSVGHLDVDPHRNLAFFRAVEQLTNQFWCTVAEFTHCRSAERLDPVSGMHTRPALLMAAEEALRESYAVGEPAVVAVIALEGLREINDAARWEVADELVASAGRILRAKLRSDDRVGRFDDSRFVLLLRRVDAELASLIVTQVLDRLRRLTDDDARWRAAVQVRCGVAGSGQGRPDLRTLLSRALLQWRRAREENLVIASELPLVAEWSAAQS